MVTALSHYHFSHPVQIQAGRKKGSCSRPKHPWMTSVCDPHVSTELGELTVLSPSSVFKRLRLVHLTGDFDKGLAGLKAWLDFFQQCQLVSIKTLPLLVSLDSLGGHTEEERLKEREKSTVFFLLTISCVWGLQASSRHVSEPRVADVTNNINEKSLYIHSHEVLTSKDCLNLICEHCWMLAPNSHLLLSAVCSSSGINSCFWTRSPERPVREKILWCLPMVIPVSIWRHTCMDFGKEDPNNVTINSVQISAQPSETVPELIFFLQQLHTKLSAVGGMAGDLHHCSLSLLVAWCSVFWPLITGL